jgi:hypothetical protein
MKNRDFMFCIVTYPAIFLVYISLRIYIRFADMDVISPRYTLISFLILIFLVILTIIEIIDTKVSHKVQGDKLKLKRVNNKWKS